MFSPGSAITVRVCALEDFTPHRPKLLNGRSVKYDGQAPTMDVFSATATRRDKFNAYLAQLRGLGAVICRFVADDEDVRVGFGQCE